MAQELPYTAEGVALQLLVYTAHAEGKTLSGAGQKPDRKWILDTYAECLKTVRQPANRGS